MKILVQTSGRPNSQLEMEYDAIQRAGYEYVSYGIIKENNGTQTVKVVGLENLDENELCFNRCTTQFYDRVHTGNFPKMYIGSVLYDHGLFAADAPPANDCNINLVPGKHRLLRFNEAMDRQVIVPTFYKPNNDLKLFDGMVIQPGSTLREALGDTSRFDKYFNIESVLMSTNIVDIDTEIRCYVVDRKVVTMSRYKLNGVFDMSEIEPPKAEVYKQAAQTYIDNYFAPSDNFTIDLADMPDGSIKIVEYNALNSSGLYMCDSKALFDAVKLYLLPRYHRSLIEEINHAKNNVAVFREEKNLAIKRWSELSKENTALKKSINGK